MREGLSSKDSRTADMLTAGSQLKVAGRACSSTMLVAEAIFACSQETRCGMH